MPLLPDTAHDLLFRDLAPLDLYNYSKANREAYQSIASFRKRAYTLNKYLLPYFTEDQIASFRALQKELGILISGSTAIQFFEHDAGEYEDSDLDLYVNHSRCYEVEAFLRKAGYRFRPRKSQQETFEANAGLVDWLMNFIFFEPTSSYANPAIAGVFDFYNAADKKVQLITAKYAPVDVILHFHSTCVMNFITHSHACSLYARATFGERRSVPSRANKARDVEARKKYHDRGWKTVGVAPDDPAIEFHDILRRVGDKHCWVIPLDHNNEEDDLVRIHTWKMDFFKKKGPLMNYHIFRSPHLANKYCVTEEVADMIAKTPLGYGNDEEDQPHDTGAPSWDHDLLQLVKNLLDEDVVLRRHTGESEDVQPKLGLRMRDVFI
ncbi:uncharacterized protein EV420DRAFT_1560053 [Desarmillaria tabescens]|uniref:Uncharacterized protein n=1 Tax=Armillaria tabescens TaxID=1929756 RepID=A0AA39JYV8_ARMTA|nr:uncharacterized protein EV420DRAFT_1560053 [Desarmillaria tabescens]KAK0451283.1 hypothetical protein EV420DRAFT_1560053 [Desarmillaria tabescens]